MDSSRITIIGGTGFIGEYLVKALISKTASKMSVIYKNSIPRENLKGVKYYQIDASKDKIALNKILRDSTHLVILSRPNIKIIENVILSGAILKKIIYASTILIYPDSKKKQNEQSIAFPINSYEAEKIEEERILSAFTSKSTTKICIARLTNIFGDIKNRGIVHMILSALVKNKAFAINNDGRQIRDFLFIEDTVKYLELLIFLDQENAVEIYNVCSGKGYSIKKLLSIVESISSMKLKRLKGQNISEKISVIGDNSKIIKVTGRKPKYDLISGLELAYRNYKQLD